MKITNLEERSPGTYIISELNTIFTGIIIYILIIEKEIVLPGQTVADVNKSKHRTQFKSPVNTHKSRYLRIQRCM